jgi:isopentenyl diphosphate isomerase/L-lactate dehydrogenase-like FMN-dependent dehydrogenase
MSKMSPPITALNQIPADIHCAQDYEVLAPRFIAAPSFAHIAGGSGHDVTVDANRAAFAEWSVWPRLLQNVSTGHTRITLLDREFAHPILLAPVALQQLVHPRGELETAHAAAAMHSCMISSTLSSFSLEEIAGAAASDQWFQLYFQPQRDITLDLVRRAERAGYTAIVVTLDTPIQAPSLRSRRAGFAMPAECVPANLQHYPQPQPMHLHAGQSRILQGMMSEAPTWQDLEWLLSETSLPVLVKGVLHADDARELRARGAAGLVVSNHGGRTLDGALASLSVLPDIRAAVGRDYPLLLDSGIRSGTNIFKALALGADAVLIGRLQVYALSVAGALGVAHMLKLLREELEICMALAGCATLGDIHPSALTTLQR